MVCGPNGYLGRKFLKAFPDAIASGADISDVRDLQESLNEYNPHVVINCAGKTGRPNVDWCEDNKSETLRSNVVGACNLVAESLYRGFRLVHIGSGCIYYGDYDGHGFNEFCPPNFFGSYYSKTKAWSDAVMHSHDDRVLNLRIRMPFDGTISDRNLIMKLSKYSRLIDAHNSMTNVDEFIDRAVRMIDRDLTGTFNMANEGRMSPYDVMSMYQEIVDPGFVMERLNHMDIGLVAKAPRSNCTLSTEKLKSIGLGMSDVHESMRLCMESLRDILRK